MNQPKETFDKSYIRILRAEFSYKFWLLLAILTDFDKIKICKILNRKI